MCSELVDYTSTHNVIVTPCSISLAIRHSPRRTGHLTRHRKPPRFKGWHVYFQTQIFTFLHNLLFHLCLHSLSNGNGDAGVDVADIEIGSCFVVAIGCRGVWGASAQHCNLEHKASKRTPEAVWQHKDKGCQKIYLLFKNM